MAVTNTPRFSLPQWSAGTDPYPGRVGFNEIHQLLENQAAVVYPSGAIANRPRSGTFGRFYLATDQGSGGRLYYDGGSGWIEINTNGGGGAGMPVVIGGVGAEGSSDRSARADHTHALPMATTTTHGALASQHYEMLATATPSIVANTLARRGGTGQLSVAGPSHPDHAVNKRYVDDTAGTYLAEANTLVRRYSNGHFRVPGSGQGDLDAINRQYMNSVSTWRNEPGTWVRRGGDATFYVGEPTKNENPATKRYTDSRTSRRAWKENWRPAPYGLAQLRDLPVGIFDYRDDEAVPAESRGVRDVLGAYVEDVAALMPALAVEGEDGAPERIKDRELIWVAVQAIRELAGGLEAARAEIARLRTDLGLPVD